MIRRPRDTSGGGKPPRRLAFALVTCLVLASVFLAGKRFLGSRDTLEAIQEDVRHQHYDRAVRGLERLLARRPGDGPAWLMLGGVRALQGLDDQALAAFGNVRAPENARAQARALAAEILLKNHRAADAERSLREAIEADPKTVEPRRRLVYLLELERRIPEARVLLLELYRLTLDARHLITLVGMTLPRGDATDPKPELLEFLKKTPVDPVLVRAQGFVLFGDGRPAEARPLLEKAAIEIEDDPIGRLALAECLLTTGEIEAAEAALGSKPQRQDDLTRWWYLKGRIEEARHQIDRALAAWQKVTAPGTLDGEALYHVAQALVRQGKADEAGPLFQRAEAIRVRGVQLVRELDRALREGRDADSFERIAKLCDDAGLHVEARAWYGEVIRLDATRRDAQIALARPEPPGLEATPLRVKTAVASRASQPMSNAGKGSTSSTIEGWPSLKFEEVGARSGLNYRYDCGATPNLYLPDTMGGGVGLIDHDGDGWLDVYFVNGGPLPIDPKTPYSPNKLFRNKRDGTFEDVTEKAGVAGLGYGMGCAVADYDGDGHDDLFVTGLGRTILYRNRGDGTFEDVTTKSGVVSDRWTTASGFGDLDGDGDLDLVVVTYVDADAKAVPACRDPLGKPMHCPPGQFPAQTDHLFRNNGNGTFTDVALDAGFDIPGGLGLGLAVVDYDDDGKLDLFVANDAAPNFLFHNLGGLKFEEVGVTAGVAYDGTGRATASMGVVAADLNGDGLVDFFHTNFLNEPNTLDKNLGNGLFNDVTLAAGLDAPSRPVTGFGTMVLDADNDGLPDLFVANGHVDDRPWVGHPMAQLPHLYRGVSPGRFELAAMKSVPYFATPKVGRGAAAGDLNNDGREDLVVVHRDAPAALLINTTEGGHWLGLRLIGRAPTTPIGTRVTCTSGGKSSVRRVTSGTSYLSQNDPRLWFGLGKAREIEKLEVRWPSGASQSWRGVGADRIVEIREGSDLVAEDSSFKSR